MLVWACIAPHGSELIRELANGSLARMAETRAAMEELERRCLAAEPETVVVYTPHGYCGDQMVCVSITHEAEGSLDGEGGSSIAARFPVDREMARLICEEASQRRIPLLLAAVDDAGEPAATMPLDWGALVPLWFMGARWKRPPSVVVVCPSRTLTRQQLLEFGEATAVAAAASGRRVALICSADQGHGHAEDGPYGFAEGSAPFDATYCAAVRENALSRLLEWEEEFVEAALTDSYWQTLMLHGALSHTPMQGELLSYEAPTYFGMAVAAYAP